MESILISKNENGITGARMKEGKWVTDVDITPLQLENYPYIMERFEIGGNLIIGYSQDFQQYYAIIMYQKDGVLSCEQYVTDCSLEEALKTLDNRLIEGTEYLKTKHLEKGKVL